MKKAKRLLSAFLAVCLIASMLSVTAFAETTNIPVTGVTLDKETASVEAGKTVTLTATATPSNATATEVTWRSSDAAVAEVATPSNATTATVNAKKTGEATITATIDGKSATCVVTVTEAIVPVTEVKLTPATASVEVGKEALLSVAVKPDNATNKDVKWETTDSSIVEIATSSNASATVKGKKVGTAKITAKAGDKSATCVVTVKNPVIEVTGVKITNKPTANVLVGKPIKLTATVNPSNATNKTVAWKSSNTKVATVASDGTVKGITAGTVKLTATAGKFSDSCTVTVVIPATSVKMNKTSATISAGKTETLNATVAPSNATYRTIRWASSNTSVATVSSKGVVTAKKAGTAIIYAIIDKPNYIRAACTVKVEVPVTSVKLNKTSDKIDIGETTKLSATVAPKNATNKTVSWKSSNTRIATVAKDGTVKAVAAGTATITATADGKSATCKITVVKPVTTVKLNVTSTYISVGKTSTLRATVSPSSRTIRWASSNTSVATVSSKGVVTAKKAGTAYIYAISDKPVYTRAACKVTVVIPAKSVKMNKTSTTISTGKTETLRATVAPSNTTLKTVRWASSNTSVATVSSKGVVTAKKAGTAYIYAIIDKPNYVRGSCKVTVVTPATSVKMNKTSTIISKGKTETLKAAVAPSNATYRTIRWASSNTSVATVSSKGVVTAKKAGTAYIYAIIDKPNYVRGSCKVTVATPATSVKMNKATTSIKVGRTETLRATIAPSNATLKTVRWASSNTSVATVSSKGVVTAKKAGTAYIYAIIDKPNYVRGSCKVTVSK